MRTLDQSTLARRAYRRPVTTADVDALLTFYDAGRRDASERELSAVAGPGPSAVEGFEAGIQRALERMLVDPDFLFRVERDPAGAAPAAPSIAISDLELASRLSFFLWSSIPDDELLDARRARAARAIRRCSSSRCGGMLADPRAQRARRQFRRPVARSCATSATRTPDPDLFPEFDENLREALQRETELFVESQLARIAASSSC